MAGIHGHHHCASSLLNSSLHLASHIPLRSPVGSLERPSQPRLGWLLLGPNHSDAPQSSCTAGGSMHIETHALNLRSPTGALP